MPNSWQTVILTESGKDYTAFKKQITWECLLFINAVLNASYTGIWPNYTATCGSLLFSSHFTDESKETQRAQDFV